MANLPIVLSFDQGTSGRFLQAVLNYLITGRALPTTPKIGTAHDATEGEQNVEFILLWNDQFCNKYVNRFPQSIDETIRLINMAHWNEDRDKLKYYMIEDINRAGYDTHRATLIAEYMNSVNSLPIIRTHLTGVLLFREVRRLIQRPITNIFITANSPIDKAFGEICSAIKNYSHLYPDPYSEDVRKLFNETMLSYASKSDIENNFIMKLFKEQDNEFFFDYASIVNKNIPYIIDFILSIMDRCDIVITQLQLEIIYKYMNDYFNKQPNLSNYITS